MRRKPWGRRWRGVSLGFSPSPRAQVGPSRWLLGRGRPLLRCVTCVSSGGLREAVLQVAAVRRVVVHVARVLEPDLPIDPKGGDIILLDEDLHAAVLPLCREFGEDQAQRLGADPPSLGVGGRS